MPPVTDSTTTSTTTPVPAVGTNPPPAPPVAVSTTSRPPAAAVNPNAPPTEEIVAATFPSTELADRTIADLVAAGVSRESIVLLSDRSEKRNFLKQYIHRDGDRHTHGGVAAVFSGLLGAVAFGMIAVATISQYMPEGFGPPVAALLGGLVGGTLCAVLGGLAFRPSDDASIEIVENFAADGTLVAVRRPLAADSLSLDEAGRVLQRNNGRAIRLRHQVSQADLHPGDLRPDQLWDSGLHGAKSAAMPPTG